MNGRRPLIIFDCDGVLIDSERLACTAVAAGLQRLGVPISADEVLARYTGVSAASMFADIAQRHAVELSGAQRLAIEQSVQDLLAAQVQAMPAAAAVIADLQRRHPVCVASSSSPPRLAASLARAGLAALLGDRVFSAHQVARGKPAPDLFLFAARAMQSPPADCVVVEDSVAGARAAAAAGMVCFGFVGGSHATPALGQALLAQGAASVFDRLAQLPLLVEGWLGRVGRQQVDEASGDTR